MKGQVAFEAIGGLSDGLILEAADSCGFQLNANAKQLKQSHSNSVLVVVRGTSNEMFSSMMETIQARIATTPHQLIVDYIDENSNEVSRAMQLCREKKPLGILFLGGNREHQKTGTDQDHRQKYQCDHAGSAHIHFSFFHHKAQKPLSDAHISASVSAKISPYTL